MIQLSKGANAAPPIPKVHPDKIEFEMFLYEWKTFVSLAYCCHHHTAAIMFAAFCRSKIGTIAIWRQNSASTTAKFPHQSAPIVPAVAIVRFFLEFLSLSLFTSMIAFGDVGEIRGISDRNTTFVWKKTQSNTCRNTKCFSSCFCPIRVHAEIILWLVGDKIQYQKNHSRARAQNCFPIDNEHECGNESLVSRMPISVRAENDSADRRKFAAADDSSCKARAGSPLISARMDGWIHIRARAETNEICLNVTIRTCIQALHNWDPQSFDANNQCLQNGNFYDYSTKIPNFHEIRAFFRPLIQRAPYLLGLTPHAGLQVSVLYFAHSSRCCAHEHSKDEQESSSSSSCCVKKLLLMLSNFLLLVDN